MKKWKIAPTDFKRIITLPSLARKCKVLFHDHDGSILAELHTNDDEAIDNFHNQSNSLHKKGVNSFVEEFNSLPKLSDEYPEYMRICNQ